MKNMVFENPNVYEERLARVYKLDDAIKNFDIDYGVNTPSINGLLFGIINACIAAKFDEKFGYTFKSGITYRRVKITLDTEDTAIQFKSQMGDLICKPIDDAMKMALIHADNYNLNHLIDGFEYTNLHDDAYTSIFYMVTEMIKSAVSDFKSIENLSDVFYQTNDKNASIRIHKNINAKRYTVDILAFTNRYYHGNINKEV